MFGVRVTSGVTSSSITHARLTDAANQVLQATTDTQAITKSYYEAEAAAKQKAQDLSRQTKVRKGVCCKGGTKGGQSVK